MQGSAARPGSRGILRLATCAAVDPPHTGISAPLRVDDAEVTVPGEGAAFPQTVREMFPEALADFVLDNPDSPEVRPYAR